MSLTKIQNLLVLLMLFSSSAMAAAVNGVLDPLPKSPNAVSSQAPKSHRGYIAPFITQGDPKAYFAQLAVVVASQPRVKIIKQTDRYIQAEFTTAMMGFVDDVEFVLDAKNAVVHVRSASRVGYYDFNANRKRIEAIRLQMAIE